MSSSKLYLPSGYVLHGTNFNYEIQKVLGQGSFGITYLAEVKMQGALGSLDSNVKVAVKEFFMKEINGRENSFVTIGNIKNGVFFDYRNKFKKEAENLSKLHHSNIVKVMELFEANNTIYYVMEYLSGGSLEQKINNNGLHFDEVVKYANQIGHAVEFMHKNKMLHLDLKPGNIVLDKDQNAILIDFGLSKQYDENGQPESSTSVGGGTPGYAPLEQANYHNEKDFPVTMDVYALGATIYKMFVGQRVPEASVILNDGFPKQTLLSKCKSKEMVACIEKAMNPIKKQRFQSVNELLQALSASRIDILHDKPTEEILEEGIPVINDGGDWGYYEVYEGEAEYGTEQIVKHRVTTHIPIPDSITIIKGTIDDKDYREFVLYNNENVKGRVVFRDNSGMLHDYKIPGGIPYNVMEYLKLYGFFSNIHWENEPFTTARFGNPVQVVFNYKNGSNYTRIVNVPGHLLLRRAVDGLLHNTSLADYIVFSPTNKSTDTTDVYKKEETDLNVDSTIIERKNGNTKNIWIIGVTVLLVIMTGWIIFGGNHKENETVPVGHLLEKEVTEESDSDYNMLSKSYERDNKRNNESVSTKENDDNRKIKDDNKKVNPENLTKKMDDVQKRSDNNKVVHPDQIDEAARFPNLDLYLSSHIRYPIIAIENDIQGTVFISFIVEKDGSLSNIKIMNEAHPSLNEEAIRIIKNMPNWIPGKVKGLPVRTKMTVPIRFKLS